MAQAASVTLRVDQKLKEDIERYRDRVLKTGARITSSQAIRAAAEVGFAELARAAAAKKR